MQDKICGTCKNILDISNFTKSSRSKDGYDNRCKKCNSNKWKKYYENNKENYKNYKSKFIKDNRKKYTEYQRGYRSRNLNDVRNRRLLKDYGITLYDYERMFEMQNGVCAICRNKSTKNLIVDHDHKNGAVRGLLCLKCNFAIGSLDDNVQYARNALMYLEISNLINRYIELRRAS